MYTADFFCSKLGQAALASVAAMTAMIALTSQISMTAQDINYGQPGSSMPMMVELA
ncbi:MAG: hypothetical protein AAFY07_06275 [Pseudomonadota bacterium]